MPFHVIIQDDIPKVLRPVFFQGNTRDNDKMLSRYFVVHSTALFNTEGFEQTLKYRKEIRVKFSLNILG